MDVLIVTFYSYILGSIPFGLILTKIAGLGDVRKIGSGNIGLTYYSAVIVFLAHIFPVWLKFKGGKGVATFIGSLLVINFYLSVVFISAWLIMLSIFRISAVSALLGYLVVTLTAFIFFDQKIFILILFYFVFSIFTHRQNIASLIKEKF
ncbi:MAG: acyl-phosphate glycerol 3-phosphate acyltransferase [Candidatus Fonsibacter ubiquis]|nr:acyl-phosphate glycerol 3-phosphate acyltransferase [Candidatus Fonsibacter ubiquis]